MLRNATSLMEKDKSLQEMTQLSQPHFEASVKMRLTFPKSGNLESFATPAISEFD